MNTPIKSPTSNLQENPSLRTATPAQTKKSLPMKYILGGIVALLLVVGGIVAYILMNQNADTRQQASGGSCIGSVPSGCKVNGIPIGGCGGRSESNCKAVSSCGCSWSAGSTSGGTTGGSSSACSTCMNTYHNQCDCRTQCGYPASVCPTAKPTTQPTSQPTSQPSTGGTTCSAGRLGFNGCCGIEKSLATYRRTDCQTYTQCDSTPGVCTTPSQQPAQNTCTGGCQAGSCSTADQQPATGVCVNGGFCCKPKGTTTTTDASCTNAGGTCQTEQCGTAKDPAGGTCTNGKYCCKPKSTTDGGLIGGSYCVLSNTATNSCSKCPYGNANNDNYCDYLTGTGGGGGGTTTGATSCEPNRYTSCCTQGCGTGQRPQCNADGKGYSCKPDPDHACTCNGDKTTAPTCAEVKGGCYLNGCKDNNTTDLGGTCIIGFCCAIPAPQQSTVVANCTSLTATQCSGAANCEFIDNYCVPRAGSSTTAATTGGTGGSACSPKQTYMGCGQNGCSANQRRYCTSDGTLGGCLEAGSGVVPSCTNETKCTKIGWQACGQLSGCSKPTQARYCNAAGVLGGCVEAEVCGAAVAPIASGEKRCWSSVCTTTSVAATAACPATFPYSTRPNSCINFVPGTVTTNQTSTSTNTTTTSTGGGGGGGTSTPPVQSGPACVGMTMEGTGALNTSVTFTCANVAGAERYEFRVKLPNGTFQTVTATGNKSANFTIAAPGEYKAQCRSCTGAAASTCHAYETI